MKRSEFEAKESFTMKELAELFDRTVVRVWQVVVKDHTVTYLARDCEKRQSGITVPKGQLATLMRIFGTEKLNVDNRGNHGFGPLPRLVAEVEAVETKRGRPLGSKNKPGHKAGRPRKVVEVAATEEVAVA